MINSDVLRTSRCSTAVIRSATADTPVRKSISGCATDRAIGAIFHVAVSGTNASAVAEGPIGHAGADRGSSPARQSYLDLIVHRLTYRAVSFGFADAQAKVAYDLSPRQRLDLTALAGRSRFKNDPIEREIDDVHVGHEHVGGRRRGLAPHAAAADRQAARARGRQSLPQSEHTGFELDNGRDRQLGYRAEVTRSVRPVARRRRAAGKSNAATTAACGGARRRIGSASCSSITTRATDSYGRVCLGALDAVSAPHDRPGRPR